MNLSAYDIINKKYSKGTWFDSDYGRLYSTEIEYHPYCTLLKRYDAVKKINDYFIALSDTDFVDAENVTITKNEKGIVKIDIKSIINESSLFRVNGRVFISIEEVDRSDEGVIYSINV